MLGPWPPKHTKSKHNGTPPRRAYGSLGNLSSMRETPRLQTNSLLVESSLRGYEGRKLISNGKVRGETSSPRDRRVYGGLGDLSNPPERVLGPKSSWGMHFL